MNGKFMLITQFLIFLSLEHSTADEKSPHDKKETMEEGERLYILVSLILFFSYFLNKRPHIFGLSSMNYGARAGCKLVLPISLIYCWVIKWANGIWLQLLKSQTMAPDFEIKGCWGASWLVERKYSMIIKSTDARVRSQGAWVQTQTWCL